MRRLLWVLLLGLALVLVILVARHDEGTVGSLSTGDFASLAVKLVMLVVVGGAVLTLFRDRFCTRSRAPPVVVGLLLVLAYTYRFDSARCL